MLSFLQYICTTERGDNAYIGKEVTVLNCGRKKQKPNKSLDPTITFHWNSPVNITLVTFYFDDTDDAGGVSAPSSVDVNGTNFPVADPTGSAPFSFVASGLAFTGNDLAVTLHRNNTWVFLSEVQFNVSPVAEPETYAMLLAGLGLVGFAVRRRKAAIV